MSRAVRLTERYRPATCPRCRRAVLAGITDAVDRYLDPAPVTPLQEIDALTHGRATFEITPGSRAVRRTAMRIEWDSGLPVYVAHDCDTPPYPSQPRPRARTSPAPALPDPPF